MKPLPLITAALSRQQRTLATLLLKGLSSHEIAKRMHSTESRVYQMIARMCRKVQIGTGRVRLAVYLATGQNSMHSGINDRLQ